MKYNKIIKQLALKEGVSKKEIEKEMQRALNIAHLNYSPRKFIKIAKSKH